MRKKKTEIQITSIYGNILFKYSIVDNTQKKTVGKAVEEKADLRRANLREADLREADLWRADLWEADLRRANLRRANLREANLRRADLREADLREADLREADLREADLRRANLWRANLREANLWRANLWRANLREADLWEADLREANLWEADLREIKNIQPIYFSDIYSLKLLPKNTILHFWKYLLNGKSPYQEAEYKVGEIYKVKNYNIDERIECGKGLNVSTLMWCLKDSMGKEDIGLIEIEFKVSDIVAIPYFTDGKFRVKKFKVLRKISRDKGMKIMEDISGIKVNKEDKDDKEK